MSILGNGATFVISSPSVAIGTLVGIAPGEQSIAVINDDSLAVSGDSESIFGKLRNNGTITLTAIMDPDEVPVASPTPSTGTLTYPPKAGQTNGATRAGTGAVTRVAETAIENDTRVLVELDWTWDGKTGPTRTDGS